MSDPKQKVPAVDPAGLGVPAGELREMAAALLDIHRSDEMVEIPDELELYSRHHVRLGRAAVEVGLGFFLGALVDEPDLAVLDLLVETTALPIRGGYDQMAELVSPYAVTVLTARLDPADPELARAAKSRSASAREALIEGVDPERPGAWPLLEALCADAHGDVRRAARDALRDAGQEPSWWVGLFPEDPFAVLDAATATALAGPLAALAAVLSRPTYEEPKTRVEELLGALRGLPDVLIVDLMPRILPAERHASGLALLVELLTREGGAAAFRRIVANLDDEDPPVWTYQLDQLIGPAATLSPARRADVRAQFGGPPRASEDSTLYDMRLFQMAVAAAHTDEEVWTLAEPVLGTKHGWLVQMVLSAKPPNPGAPLAEHAVRALLDGFQGRWGDEAWSIETWLLRAPGEWLRPFAEQAIRAESERVRRWGLRALTGPAWNPSDGPRPQRARALALDPRFATDFLHDDVLARRALEHLREQLREGLATLEQAALAIRLAARAAESDAPKDEHIEPTAPVTEAEWAELRRLRVVAAAEGDPAARAIWYGLDVREQGHPEDDALIARLAAEVTNGDDAGQMLVRVLFRHWGRREGDLNAVDLAVADAMHARFSADPDFAPAWRLIESRRKLRW